MTLDTQCCNAECQVCFIVMLSMVRLNVFMLSVVLAVSWRPELSRLDIPMISSVKSLRITKMMCYTEHKRTKY